MRSGPLWVSRLHPSIGKPARFRFAWTSTHDKGGATARAHQFDVEGRTMPTISQLIRKPRDPKVYREKARHLEACPQKRGVCTRVYTTTPKKPNSALRKV